MENAYPPADRVKTNAAYGNGVIGNIASATKWISTGTSITATTHVSMGMFSVWPIGLGRRFTGIYGRVYYHKIGQAVSTLRAQEMDVGRGSWGERLLLGIATLNPS
jgi:hypothetical protein